MFLNFAEIIENPAHKDGNILDAIICNHLGSDRIISHSVNPPLTDTCYYNLILPNIVIIKYLASNPKISSCNFNKAEFKDTHK